MFAQSSRSGLTIAHTAYNGGELAGKVMDTTLGVSHC